MSKAIAEALCAAQGAIDGIDKAAKNDFHKYRYTSIDQMVAAVRGCLRGAGLVVLPTAHRVDGTTMVTEWVLLHTSGDSMSLRYDMPIVPEKGRPLDKASSAAASQALNYLLRDLMLLPRGEREQGTHVEVDARDDRGHDPHPMRPALERAGLTREQWDAWAKANKRTAVAQMDRAQSQSAAAWLDGEGSAVVSGWIQQNGGK